MERSEWLREAISSYISAERLDSTDNFRHLAGDKAIWARTAAIIAAAAALERIAAALERQDVGTYEYGYHAHTMKSTLEAEGWDCVGIDELFDPDAQDAPMLIFRRRRCAKGGGST